MIFLPICLKRMKESGKMILESIKTGKISAALFAAVFAAMVHLTVANFAFDQLSRLNEILDCAALAGPQQEECVR